MAARSATRTGRLFYNARYYDPGLGRFVSADTIVPGNASGGMEGVAVKPLTVGFHENQFLGQLNQENQLAPWALLSDEQRQQAGRPWGPSNPQALNRYAYVLNNPLRWTDPTGHNPGNRSAGGKHYRHVRGPLGGEHSAGGYNYKVDPVTGYYYRDTPDGRHYLMETCIDGKGCKYTDSSSAIFSQFKAAVDAIASTLLGAATAGIAGAVLGCAAGAGAAIAGVITSPVAPMTCLITAGVTGAAAFGAVFVVTLIFWSDEADRAYASMSSLVPPARRRK